MEKKEVKNEVRVETVSAYRNNHAALIVVGEYGTSFDVTFPHDKSATIIFQGDELTRTGLALISSAVKRSIEQYLPRIPEGVCLYEYEESFATMTYVLPEYRVVNGEEIYIYVGDKSLIVEFTGDIVLYHLFLYELRTNLRLFLSDYVFHDEIETADKDLPFDERYDNKPADKDLPFDEFNPITDYITD